MFTSCKWFHIFASFLVEVKLIVYHISFNLPVQLKTVWQHIFNVITDWPFLLNSICQPFFCNNWLCQPFFSVYLNMSQAVNTTGILLNSTSGSLFECTILYMVCLCKRRSILPALPCSGLGGLPKPSQSNRASWRNNTQWETLIWISFETIPLD